LAEDGLHFWLYASRFNAGQTAHDIGMIDEIVAQSKSRNRACSVTGALIFTGGHFAQYIEGPSEGLQPIKQSILSDSRHSDARTVGEGMVRARRFGDWAMAYNGQFPAFDKLVSRAYASKGSAGEILLMEMLRRFSLTL